MNSSKYPLYAFAIVVGGAVAIWAGVSPFFLIFLLVCPLMMFMMMRGGMGGMHGGHGGEDAPPSRKQDSAPTASTRPDGSHEHIDCP